jgi:hypothetical protein
LSSASVRITSPGISTTVDFSAASANSSRRAGSKIANSPNKSPGSMKATIDCLPSGEMLNKRTRPVANRKQPSLVSLGK